jgi:hypothetical protein
MSESEKTTALEDAELRRLLEEAGPRPSVPEEDLAAIREAAHAAWTRRYGGRRAPERPGRWWMGLAAAAVLAVVLGLVWWGRTSAPPPTAPQVASIEVLTGVVRMWRAPGEEPVLLPPGLLRQPLPAGAELETAGGANETGRVALRMTGGASVRLDAGTRVWLDSAQSIELGRGALYVDSGGKPGGPGEMAVRTAAGLFQDVGTQFEIRIEGSGPEAVTRLRVREGRVVLDRGSLVTDAGGELAVHGDGRIDQRMAVVYGPEWDWVLQTAPRLDIEGLDAGAFLDWIAREAGWRIEYADAEAASLAGSTVLHGSIGHLSPAEAPGVVLASCGLGHRVSEGILTVYVDKTR